MDKCTEQILHLEKGRNKPGVSYHYEIDMVPTDHVLDEGHELALILYGIDAQADTETGIR